MHPTITNAIGPDGRVVHANNSNSVTTGLDVTGQINGVGSSRFINGQTPQFNSAGANLIASTGISVNVPSYGTWYISIIWYVSIQQNNGPSSNLWTSIIANGGPVSSMTSAQMGVGMAVLNVPTNMTIGSSCTATNGTCYFLLRGMSTGGAITIQPGSYVMELFRLS